MRQRTIRAGGTPSDAANCMASVAGPKADCGSSLEKKQEKRCLTRIQSEVRSTGLISCDLPAST